MNGLELDSLEPQFADLCVKLIVAAANEGVLVKPYSGVRSPSEQAKLWRQGRAIGEIEVAARKLKDYKAPYLASCLLSVGPQVGAKVTNALPGESWHQWGEALDFYVIEDNGDLVVDGKDPRYLVFGEIAHDLNLTSGVFWVNPDPGHIQFRSNSVKAFYQWPDINQIMRERYEH